MAPQLHLERAHQSGQSELHVPVPRGLEVKLTSDALLVLALLGWLVWDRLLRSRVISKLDGAFAPIEEERALNNILAQIGVITNATRVVLCAFHNGAIDSSGYHLSKLTAINHYTAPGHIPMAVPIRDLPVGRIMVELEELLDPRHTNVWVPVEYRDDLPDPCKDHLLRNDIRLMWNRLIRVGNLPIGILSLQYSSNERRQPPIGLEPYNQLLEELYTQIAHIMRRRVIHPSLMQRLWMRISRRSFSRPTC